MRIEVLRLYKDLMRYGQRLELTDPKFFRFKVRKDFKLNENLTEEDDIKFYIKKGQQLLKARRVI